MSGPTRSWRDAPPPEARRGAAAVGNFDGVHRGHAALMARLRADARAAGGPAVAVTFDPHPLALLAPAAAPVPLTTLAERERLLKLAGADVVLVLRADADLLALDAEAFFRELLLERLDARAVVEGFNFRFGRGRAGDNAALARLCADAGRSFAEVGPVLDDGTPVSSSRIRAALLEGRVADAARWLGRPYRVAGTVAEGAKRGRTLGFPTANLSAVPTLLPGVGVYAMRALVAGRTFAVAANVGPNPTFGEDARKVELHLIDFAGDLYGQTLEADFLQFLRPTRPFAGPDALREQLARDVAAARDALREPTP